MLPRNKRFSVKVCYGWGRLSLSATILILQTREKLLFAYTFHVLILNFNVCQKYLSYSIDVFKSVLLILNYKQKKSKFGGLIYKQISTNLLIFNASISKIPLN